MVKQAGEYPCHRILQQKKKKKKRKGKKNPRLLE